MTIKDLKPGEKFKLQDNPNIFRLMDFGPPPTEPMEVPFAIISTPDGRKVHWIAETEVFPPSTVFQLALFK